MNSRTRLPTEDLDIPVTGGPFRGGVKRRQEFYHFSSKALLILSAVLWCSLFAEAATFRIGALNSGSTASQLVIQFNDDAPASPSDYAVAVRTNLTSGAWVAIGGAFSQVGGDQWQGVVTLPENYKSAFFSGYQKRGSHHRLV